MKKCLIVTLPRHDLVTEYLSYFSKKAVEEAKIQGFSCKELKDTEANKQNFQKACEKLNPLLIILNGHGTESNVLGHKNEPIIEENINHNLLSGKITYVCACDCGSSLGVTAMKQNKDGCFIGYNLPFQFYCDKTWESNPEKDQIAPWFLEPSNLVSLSIIKGKSCREAFETSQRAMLKNMNKSLRRGDKNSLQIASALWNNYDGQVIIGNEDARIE